MYSKVSVLVPTRKRLNRLNSMLLSYERTTKHAEHLSELVFRADDDDVETQQFLATTSHTTVVGPRMQGYTSMPQFYNEALARATGDVIMCANDDMLFKTDGWASAVLAAASAYPDGLFNIGVSIFNEDHYPLCIVSKTVTDALGFFWDPRIFWGDIFLRDVMGAFGRCVKLPSVEVEHDWAGHAPDSTFSEANQQDIFRRDPNYWSGTHATAVADAVRRLREMAA